MKKVITIGLVFLLWSFNTVSTKKSIPNFKLKNASNNAWVSLSDYNNNKGFIIVFICNKCPMAKLYLQRLNQLDAKYKKLGVPIIAINAMDTLVYEQESFANMQKKVKREQFHFPYLQDKKQSIAKQFQATCTPQAFVIWKDKTGKYSIRYEGAIDDNAGEPEKVTHHFLINATDELLQQKKVTTPETETFGCRIFYRGQKNKMN